MRTVRMRHDRLGREIEVPATAARIWGKSGWELVEDRQRPATRKSGTTAEKKQEG